MNQKQLFSIFSLGFVSLLVFALTFSACNNSTSPTETQEPIGSEAQTPVAKDFTFRNLTQTAGNVVPVTIVPKPGKSDGAITILYNGSKTLPTAVGTYTVTFNVAKASDWKAARGLSAGTLTINATDQDPLIDDFEFGNLIQTAGSVTPVSITPRTGKSDGEITIYYNGSTTLPTAVGTYTVTFDVAAAVGFNAAVGLAAGTLTIENQTPVAEDYVFGNLTQTEGSIIEVSITPRPGKSGGARTIYYNGSTTLPTAVGTYTVTFDVAAAVGFNAAVGLVAGTLTINATDQDPAAGDFDIGNLTQTEGSVTPVTIRPQPGKSAGEITVYYDGSTTLPATAGTYTVTFDVASATGFRATVGLAAGTLTINAAVPSNVKYKIYSNGVLDSNYSLSDWSAVKTTNLESTEGGGHSGDKAIKLPNTGDRYLSIRANNANTINWSTVDALSFWVKGDDIRVIAFGFLDDAVSGKDALNVEYKGEDGTGIMAANTWQQIVIPLPASNAKGAAISRREVFKLWITTAENNNKTLYIDDIDLVSTPRNFEIVIPSTKSISAGTVSIAELLGNYKAEYMINGKKISLFSNTVKFSNWFEMTYNASGGASISGDNITATGNFTLTVGFGGKTSNTLQVTVTQPPPASNVKYKIYSDGTLSEGYTITNWANEAAFQLASTAGGGHSGTKAMRLPDTGNNNWGRGLSIRASSASAINWSTVDALSFWVKGDNVRVNSFGLLDDEGSGRDTLNIEYKGENEQGITITNNWQNILIPLPNSTAKGAAISRIEVFKVYITNAADQDNKAVYIDDIELVSTTKNFTIAIPASAQVPAGTVAISSLLGNYKAEYTIDGKKVSLFNNTVKFANWFDMTYNVGSGATRNGENLTVTGNFTLSVGFGGKTSNTLSATSANVVYYSQYGAVGNGVTDDFTAIINAHTAANSSGAMVRAEAGKTYYIGGGNRTASIKTNTDWTGAKFIIDDTKVVKSSGTAWSDSWIFQVESAQASRTITSSVTSFTKNQAKLNISLSSAAVIVAIDNSKKRYIRRGENANSGADQTDVFIVDQNGNVDPSAPIIWDFTRVSSLVAYPIDAQTLTITGGEFTTRANTGNADDNYMKRGIRIVRSNTVIDGLTHLITGEGSQAAPYDAFLKFENCANVTVKNTRLTGHRGYPRPSQPSTTRGTYDVNAARTVNLSFIDCDQSNSITNGTYWGIFASNYSKNILFDRVKFSRFDAHQGVRNVTLKNSELGHQGVSTIGSGLLLIENTKVSGSNFIYFRDDYGSTWEGELRIINCTFAPPNLNSAQIIHTNNDGRWDFGYPCYMPETITINGFTVVETSVPSGYNGVLLVSAVNTNTNTEPYPFRLTKTINLSGYNSSKNYRMSNTYISSQITVNRN